MVKSNGVILENVATGAQVTSETWYANQIRTIGLSLNQQLTSQIEKFKLDLGRNTNWFQNQGENQMCAWMDHWEKRLNLLILNLKLIQSEHTHLNRPDWRKKFIAKFLWTEGNKISRIQRFVKSQFKKENTLLSNSLSWSLMRLNFIRYYRTDSWIEGLFVSRAIHNLGLWEDQTGS